jgi:hypothetical protein
MPRQAKPNRGTGLYGELIQEGKQIFP